MSKDEGMGQKVVETEIGKSKGGIGGGGVWRSQHRGP